MGQRRRQRRPLPPPSRAPPPFPLTFSGNVENLHQVVAALRLREHACRVKERAQAVGSGLWSTSWLLCRRLLCQRL